MVIMGEFPAASKLCTNGLAVFTCHAVPCHAAQEEQRALLKFVTSVSRAPLGGFKHLTPPLTIHKARPCCCPLPPLPSLLPCAASRVDGRSFWGDGSSSA